MKKLTILLITAIFSFDLSAQYDSQNINLLGVFNDTNVVAEPVYGIRYQACWGWSDSLGNEYGIIGSTAGTYIVNVTTPTNPVLADYIPHRQTDCIWHEYKTYGKYLYIISDDGGNNSLQIADLSYLPDSAHVVYDSTDIFVHAHTLFIDRDKLYVASVSTSTNYSSMNVYSLSNPEHPTLLRRIDQDYNNLFGQVHDMYVVNDTVYASCGYDGLFIFRFDTTIGANQFYLLGSLQDGFNNYNHSSVLSHDRSTLYVCEEVPDGRPVKIIDVTNISNPTLIDTFYSNAGATPHNPEILGNKLIIGYYQDGVYVYDITNPIVPVRLGYFDTYYLNPPGTYFQPAYNGVWSTYAHLPSGVLLASDTEFGLFVLDISNTTGINDLQMKNFSIYPNPATARLTIKTHEKSALEITDLAGKIMWKAFAEAGEITVNTSEFAAGMYIVRMKMNDSVTGSKIIIR